MYSIALVKKAINITLLSSSWLTLTQSIWKKIPTNNLIIAVWGEKQFIGALGNKLVCLIFHFSTKISLDDATFYEK